MAHAPFEDDEYRDDIRPDDPDAFRAPLGQHLEELRTRIMRSLLFLCGGWVAGWFLEPYVYAHLNGILSDPSIWPKGARAQEAFTNFSDAFFLKFKLALVTGLIIAAPVIVVQLWGFIRPALRANERKALRIVGPLSAVLFLVGVFFGYLILKPAFGWFLSFLEDFDNTILLQNPGSFVVFVLKMLLAFGIGFQLPLVVWFLGKIELLTSESLWKNWRAAIVAIIAVSAFLTPGGDFFSLSMMAAPLTVMYFAGIAAVKVTERKRKRRHDAELD